MKYKMGDRVFFEFKFNNNTKEINKIDRKEGIILSGYVKSFDDPSDGLPKYLYLIEVIDTNKEWHWVYESDII